MQKETKKNTPLQVIGAVKVKPTKAAIETTFTTSESLHYFKQPTDFHLPICAMNIETASNLQNCFAKLFDSPKEGLQNNQQILLDILKFAVGNKENNDSFNNAVYVETIGNVLELLSVCNQINLDTISLKIN